MLYNVHLTSEKVNNTAMISDQTRVVLAACDCLGLDISRLKLALNVSTMTLVFFHLQQRYCVKKSFFP